MKYRRARAVRDLIQNVDVEYIHYNPVKHGLVEAPRNYRLIGQP
jgi:hypothetical protein